MDGPDRRRDMVCRNQEKREIKDSFEEIFLDGHCLGYVAEPLQFIRNEFVIKHVWVKGFEKIH